MEINEICERIRQMDISQIVQLRIPLSQNGSSYFGICPFHNDTSLGSFVVTPSKGIFKCFSCGTGGDAIKFISLYDNISYYEAAIRIAVSVGLIPKSEGEKFLNKKISKQEIYELEKLYTNVDKTKKKKLDIDKINYMYHYFKLGRSLLNKNNNRLTNEHLLYLHNRGISDEEIEKSEYFSMPSMDIMPIMNQIANITKQNFTGVPGFFFNKSKNRVEFQEHKGIGIPIKNAMGKIVGIQVRRDYVSKGKQRYVWFSSSFADSDDNLQGGSSPGSPLDVVLPEKIEYYQETSDYPCSKTVFITEGHFKAAKLSEKYNSVAISVQGVGNYSGIHTTLEDVNNRYKNRIKNVYIAFDADMVFNIQVFKHAMKMYTFLKKLFKNKYNFSFVVWDVKYGKGIDDVIDAGNSNHLKKINADKFINLYLSYIKKMLIEENIVPSDSLKSTSIENLFETNSKINNLLKNISDKTMEKYYQKYVLSQL